MKNNGKYQHASTRRKAGGRKFVLLMSMAVLLVSAVGGTVAYLITETLSVRNQFVPGHVDCVVYADGSIGLSSETNVDAYVRATYAVNWMEDNNIVYNASAPEVIFAEGSSGNWTGPDDNGFYYYKGVMSPGDAPVPFITGCTDGARVEIAAEAIQAVGDRDDNGKPAVQDAWGNTPGG